VFKEHINFDRIVLQPKTWRPDVIEVCPIFYYSHLTFPFSRSMDSPGQTVSLKSEKFEMDLGRLAPASEVAESADHAFLKMVR
jgi:hypothetical protein